MGALIIAICISSVAAIIGFVIGLRLGIDRPAFSEGVLIGFITPWRILRRKLRGG